MPSVRLKENEPFDLALRRFKRSCEKAGVLAEVRRREFYEKPTSVRKRKAAAAPPQKAVARKSPSATPVLISLYPANQSGTTHAADKQKPRRVSVRGFLRLRYDALVPQSQDMNS